MCIRERRTKYEVIGHTDTLGGFALQPGAVAGQGAVRFATGWSATGSAANAISIAGRGKLDMLIPTDDQVAEPRNRVVEILVR